MKKTFFLMMWLCMACFAGNAQDSSSTNIPLIKDDSTKRPPPHHRDDVDDNERKEARKEAANLKFDANHPPIISFTMADLTDLLTDKTTINPKDSLVFYIIKIKNNSNGRKRVTDYNSKYGTNYTVTDFKNTPMLLVNVCTNGNCDLNLRSTTRIIGKVCPPPVDNTCN
jgi:hypothetical protein